MSLPLRKAFAKFLNPITLEGNDESKKIPHISCDQSEDVLFLELNRQSLFQGFCLLRGPRPVSFTVHSQRRPVHPPPLLCPLQLNPPSPFIPISFSQNVPRFGKNDKFFPQDSLFSR